MVPHLLLVQQLQQRRLLDYFTLVDFNLIITKQPRMDSYLFIILL